MKPFLSRTGFAIGRRGQVVLTIGSFLLVIGFCLAASVSPEARGFGTHQQFGLPPCSFQTHFNVPCPSCGMTTAFAHFVRGHWFSAAKANATGSLLALLCFLLIPWSWISVVKRQLWRVPHPDWAAVYLLSLIYLVGITEWVMRFWKP